MTNSSWANAGRLVLGVLFTLSGGGKLAMALLHGQSKMFMFETSLADRPLLFAAAVLLWTLVLVGGLSYIYDGISGFRRRAQAGA